ncbi:DNA excision repair protein ERCC-6-like [Gadus chalcogrammus]|uniref:DNA excision repair protein ERCC-6-like n=1 Tax=Gadus chalcogrammus TaxID=1042646 RepID=UPI0024C2535B|nr:DNA excision repair protein ERCC-6-like [Gadus chalcogrammus]
MSDEEIMNVSRSDQNIACISDKLEKLMSTETNDKMDIYHSYIKDGKNAARQGDMSKALDFFKRAHKIHPSEKLKSRIQKIEELIAEQASESEDEEFVNIDNSGLMLFRELHDKLYEHQIKGVSFMYSLHRDGLKGGILADDMGLGKTIQVIAFLSGMYDAELVKHTLLVLPTSLITNWTKEFAKWTPGMRVKEFHGTSKVERTRNLEKVQRRGGVVITTYQMLILNCQQIASYNGQEFKWDYMILDEAHKIKTSSTKTAKSAHAIPARNRVLLTGTPVQNNLREMWALFDFACQGALLGTSKTFKTEYENPITRAREKDATPGEKTLGLKMSQNLIAIIQPYFLRRTKADVQKKNSEKEKEQRSKTENGDIEVSETEKYNGTIMPELRRKNDLIIWTYLSDVQEDIYRQFLSLDHIKELLTTTRSPLAELNVIKKLCDHPRLLSAAAMAQLGLHDSTPENLQAKEEKGTSHSLDGIPDDILIAESGKMVFLMELLERLKMEGHRTLVFAHFRKVLDILERLLGNRGFKTIRLDGTITKLDERERLISLFQNDKRYSVFLLTTQVGGVGITLTAANRVVIYDPSWNPATDAQAVDRAYRIGQTENVVIYRLITCGTVEEKIYRRQVFKDSIIRQTTGDKRNPFRYFSKQELKELFTLQETRSSSTQMQLQSLHSRHRRTDPVLDEHIAYLHSMEMFGISDHDLLFSLDSNQNDDEEDPEDQEAQQYIEGRVRKAEVLMKAESELHMQLAENMESSTEPAWHRRPTQPDKEMSNGRRVPNRKPRSPIVYIEDGSDGSPVVVELDQSGSTKEESEQKNTNGFIDLTIDDGMEGKQPDLSSDTTEPNASPRQHSFTVEQSEVKAEDNSVHNVSSDMKSDDATSEYNASLDGSVSGDIHDRKQLDQESFYELDNYKNQATAMDEEPRLDEPLPGQRPSILKISNVSFNDEEASMSASEVKTFEENFHLLLDDSENAISTVHDLLEEPDVEAQEMKLLSELQMQGSFNIDKSLAEFKQEHRMSLNHSYVSESDHSGNESIIKTKKKRVAVFSDSEEEGENDEELRRMSRNLTDSFQALEASTPKTLPSGRTPLQARRSFGGNISVASRRSMIESIVEDVENDLDFEEEQFSENISGVVGGDSEETSVHSVDKLEIDETKGEIILMESEEDENDQESDVSASLGVSQSGGDAKSILEDSTTDPQSASVHSESNGSDQMASGSDQSFDSEGKSYEELVCRGKQYYGEGKLQDALDLFLKAIDISSGDNEIQLLVIQLYRQMSDQRRSSLPRKFPR